MHSFSTQICVFSLDHAVGQFTTIFENDNLLKTWQDFHFQLDLIITFSVKSTLIFFLFWWKIGELWKKFPWNWLICGFKNFPWKCSTLWKLQKLTLTKKFRQINYLVRLLLSRNFCQKWVWVNFRNQRCMIYDDVEKVYETQDEKTRNSLSSKNISWNQVW